MDIVEVVIVLSLSEKLEAEAEERAARFYQDVEQVQSNVSGSVSGQKLWLYVKRIIDIAGSAIGLIVLAPLLLGIAILVKIDSPGPVIFAQRRVGKDSSEFTFYKFRSMRVDADERLHEEYMAKLIKDGTEDLKGDSGTFKLENDPRVTRIGRFLRKSSLDELPQLFNVLKGEMSLVGPRPAIPYEVAMYEPWHARRLSVKPGITGLWQVSGRCEKNFHEMVELDLNYIDAWSVGLDLRVLLKTVNVVLKKQGAW